MGVLGFNLDLAYKNLDLQTDKIGCDSFVNKGMPNFIKGFTLFVLKYKSTAWACQLFGCQESPIMDGVTSYKLPILQ